jgi:hypothetical protein
MRLRALSIKNSAENILVALKQNDAEANRNEERETRWFEYLEELSVECSPYGGLSEAVSLLRHVGNVTKLASLDVARTGGIPTENECRNFIQGLADLITTPPSTDSLSLNKHRVLRVNHYLKRLHIHQGDETGFLPLTERPIPVAKYTTTVSTLSPLLSFAELSELTIMVDTRFSLDDEDAQRMARAWPKLKQLELGYCGGGWEREGKTFTLQGLRAFATHCPDLEELGVSVNICSVEPVIEQDERPGRVGGERKVDDGVKDARCQKLRYLELGDSVYLGEPERVARSLLDIFPKLSGVYGPNIAASPEWEKKWMQVSKIVHEIQGSRSMGGPLFGSMSSV